MADETAELADLVGIMADEIERELSTAQGAGRTTQGAGGMGCSCISRWHKHIDHTEWAEPASQGSYRCPQDGSAVCGLRHPLHSSSHMAFLHIWMDARKNVNRSRSLPAMYGARALSAMLMEWFLTSIAHFTRT
jgi:hypothetical protein